MISNSWRLDNYVVANGVPRGPKSGSDYEVRRAYDIDGDGETDNTVTELFYDVLLEHRHKDAELFVRTVPLSNDDAEKELSAFAARYVEAAAGSGTVVVRFGAEGPIGTVGRRFATRVLTQSECTVADQPALRVDFEVANVDQLQLSRDARWSRLRLVLVRTPFKRELVNHRAEVAEFPVLMIAGLATAPENFGQLSPDLDLFLDAIEINGKAGSSCKVSENAPDAAAEPTPAPADATTLTSGGEATPADAAPPAAPVAPEAAPPASP